MKVNKALFILQLSKLSTVIDPSRYSNWPRLCRVTAYSFRFINNAKSRNVSGPLLPDEIASAESYWVKVAQRELGSWKERYRELTPFEKDVVVHVGGRLARSPLSYDENHPLLLPAGAARTIIQRGANIHICAFCLVNFF